NPLSPSTSNQFTRSMPSGLLMGSYNPDQQVKVQSALQEALNIQRSKMSQNKDEPRVVVYQRK
ncbi:MAG: hypothetical protein WD512_08910, partial [Candidatus Paceibacterota bacterium]